MAETNKDHPIHEAEMAAAGEDDRQRTRRMHGPPLLSRSSRETDEATSTTTTVHAHLEGDPMHANDERRATFQS